MVQVPIVTSTFFHFFVPFGVIFFLSYDGNLLYLMAFTNDDGERCFYCIVNRRP